MTAHFIRLFLPHPHNNHKPKLLHHYSLIVLLGLFVMAQSAINLYQSLKPGILGYASFIPPEAIIDLTNAKRQELGLSALKVDPQLSQAALAKAADMFNKGYWAHNAPDGTEPWSFILNSGYSYLYAGENLARDFSDATSVVNAWMNSPTHKANLLSSKYQNIGVAVLDGRLYGADTTLVVQMFGSPINDQSRALSQSTKNSLINPVLAQESPTSAEVSFSPFILSRSISLAFISLLILVLAFDWLIIWRRQIVRISGKTWAHLTYFVTIVIFLIILKQGIIL
ncbi:hypothetical protein HY333_02010 [Candidatus Collierbacteria bacterium]|nr:hypothetical protein [Candidatus Collierbacteria bacterium]